MAETIEAPSQEFVTSEGEKFTGSVESYDVNDVMYGENDEIESIFDRESGKRFYASEDIAKQNKAVADPPEGEAPKENPEGEPKEGEEDPPEKKPTNHVQYLFDKIGEEVEEVEVSGEKKKIADLSPSDQLNVIATEFEQVYQKNEELSKELDKVKLDTGLSESEKSIVDLLRGGAKPIELADAIYKMNEGAMMDRKTDEEVMKISLQKQYGEMSDEDINDEVEYLKKNGKLEARAEAIRQQYVDNEQNLDGLSDVQKELQAKNAKAIEDDYKEDVKMIQDYAAETKEVAGYPVDKNIVDYLTDRITPTVAGEESEFLKTIDTPERLMRLAFLDTYYEQIVEALENNYKEKADKAVDETTRKYSDVPLQTGGASIKGKKVVAQPKTIDDIDIEKMTDVKEF